MCSIFPYTLALQLPVHCSPAEKWCCAVQEPALTRVLWMLDPARRAPGIRQRASELRERSRPCSPSGAARIRPTPANPANCRETSFGTVLGFQQMRSAYPNSFFSPSLPSCILSFLRPSNTSVYSLLYCCTGTVLYSNFSLLSTLTSAVRCRKYVFVLFLFLMKHLFLASSTLEHEGLDLEGRFPGKAAISPACQL